MCCFNIALVLGLMCGLFFFTAFHLVDEAGSSHLGVSVQAGNDSTQLFDVHNPMNSIAAPLRLL
jgi:hypothetical protein